MLETHFIKFGQSWNSCVIISTPAVDLNKLRQLSEPAALKTLSWYFDATRDSDMPSAPVQVRHIF